MTVTGRELLDKSGAESSSLAKCSASELERLVAVNADDSMAEGLEERAKGERDFDEEDLTED